MKCSPAVRHTVPQESPSTRREWIEIQKYKLPDDGVVSPSTRREWIEISGKYASEKFETSPSTRREWIEIDDLLGGRTRAIVSLHTEGVD